MTTLATDPGIENAITLARDRLRHVFTPNQVLGRSRGIGCVAVEVTQRCNLDCTLCYLSENSESVADLPVDEILNRLDKIVATYGTGTNVQITGGDPTLRKHSELIEIVRHARSIGLYPALLTNGIAASGKLLRSLADAGLTEVAFHVDTTQQRAGYASESDLNTVRAEYMERARGLGLLVMFNTTVHASNINEIPALVDFFIANAGRVGFASFQLQADTGRGTWQKRDEIVSLERVRSLIAQGTQQVLPWDVIRIGHPDCHSYVPTIVVNGSAYPVIEDSALFALFLKDFAHLHPDRRSPRWQMAWRFLQVALARPAWFWRGVKFLTAHLWRARSDLAKAHGQAHKMSFFVQNFMDAENLDENRVSACSFMVMTADGPISMCEHNSLRDRYILQPIEFFRRDGSVQSFDPLYRQRPTLRETA